MTIIDYGLGNLLSVQRGLEYCGARVTLASDPDTILASRKLVLPGVGAFPKAMDALNGLNLVSVIQEFAKLERPLLAICLGMQLLMDDSHEFGLNSGLSLIPGTVIQIPGKSVDGIVQKIPHIGWSGLQYANSKNNWADSLLANNKVGDAAYFVHSYMAVPLDPEHLMAETIYGGHRISAVIAKNQITGCQFHPEKSGEIGLKILKRFAAA